MPDRDRMTSEPGPSRRTMLRGAAGIGAAGLAAGAIAGLAAAPAFAATDQPASGDRPAAAAAAGAEHSDHAAAAEPVVVHLRDARTGELDVFRGTSQFRLRDRDLAARLLQAGQ
jgi:hypothetical protein